MKYYRPCLCISSFRSSTIWTRESILLECCSNLDMIFERLYSDIILWISKWYYNLFFVLLSLNLVSFGSIILNFFFGLSRSIDGLEKRIPSYGNESIFPDPEDDFTATSESCSGVADDKVCSSDNQNSSLMKRAELLKGYLYP